MGAGGGTGFGGAGGTTGAGGGVGGAGAAPCPGDFEAATLARRRASTSSRLRSSSGSIGSGSYGVHSSAGVAKMPALSSFVSVTCSCGNSFTVPSGRFTGEASTSGSFTSSASVGTLGAGVAGAFGITGAGWFVACATSFANVRMYCDMSRGGAEASLGCGFGVGAGSAIYFYFTREAPERGFASCTCVPRSMLSVVL
jgi:hypothetical protein